MKKLEEIIVQRGAESARAQEVYCHRASEQILQAARSLARAVGSGGKILVAGNGGSAADAQHFAGELVNRFLMERRPLPCISLATDTSVITSISNDYSYDLIFSKQIEAVGKEGDALIAISTSGTSPNILRALEAANRQSLMTVGMSGPEEGPMADLCDYYLAPGEISTPRVQEIHHLVLHILAELLEILVFAGKND